jgi:uncharacterized protein
MAENQGILPLNEKARPEEIEKTFHMSKASFKRAIGRLLKEKRVVKTDVGVKLA